MPSVLLEIFLQIVTSVALAMHSRSLSSGLQMMSLSIDMKIIRPLNCDGSPILFMNSWTLLMSCNVVNPGKYPTRIPSALRQFCPKFCIVVNLWAIPTVVPKQYLMLGSDSPFQDITQNLRIRKPLHAIDWWLFHHWTKMIVAMKNLPNWLETLQKSHPIVRLPTVQICQTSVSKWNAFLYFWWNVKISE